MTYHYYFTSPAKLAECIVRKGYATKKEFCKASGIDYGWLVHMNLNGTSAIGSQRVAMALNVPVDELFVETKKERAQKNR